MLSNQNMGYILRPKTTQKRPVDHRKNDQIAVESWAAQTRSEVDAHQKLRNAAHLERAFLALWDRFLESTHGMSQRTPKIKRHPPCSTCSMSLG